MLKNKLLNNIENKQYCNKILKSKKYYNKYYILSFFKKILLLF